MRARARRTLRRQLLLTHFTHVTRHPPLSLRGARAPGCALLALSVPEARAAAGPLVPGAHPGPHGARVPGTDLVLDPCAAAFSTGALVAWLEYNDAWLGAEW